MSKTRLGQLLGEHGIQQDTPAGRQEFERQMEQRRLEEVDEEALKQIREGWCLGSEVFRKERLEQMAGKLGDNHPGQARLETAEAKAERLVREQLQLLGWTEADLAALRAFGTPILSQVGPMPYTAVNQMLDPVFPPRSLQYWKSSFVDDLADELIDRVVEDFTRCPSASMVTANLSTRPSTSAG